MFFSKHFQMSLCCDIISASESNTVLSSRYTSQFKSTNVTLGGVPGTMGVIIEGNTIRYEFHVTNPNVVAATVFQFPVFGNSSFTYKAELSGVLLNSSGVFVGAYNLNQWAGCYCIAGSSPVSSVLGSGVLSMDYSNGFPGASTALTTGGIGGSTTNPASIMLTFNATPSSGTPCTLDCYIQVTQISNTLT